MRYELKKTRPAQQLQRVSLLMFLLVKDEPSTAIYAVLKQYTLIILSYLS